MIEQEPVGIAIIGSGGYAKELARAAKESPKLRLVGCYDPRQEAAEEFASKYGCKPLDLKDLLRDEAVEGVVIGSPNSSHRENAVAAAEAGKHVFVDKPIANEISDALAMIDACRERNLVLAVGHNTRRLDTFRQMKAMVSAGDVGQPITVEANGSHGGGLNLTGKEWRSSREGCPGLPLMQIGVHLADTMHYLFGDITDVSSFVTRLAIPADNDDTTVSILKFKEGFLGYLGSNYATPPVFYLNVYGTGGNLLGEGGSLRYRKAGEREYRDIPIKARDTQMEELEEFGDCIRFGCKPEVDGEMALKALAVVRAALESDRLGRPFKLQELGAGI